MVGGIYRLRERERERETEGDVECWEKKKAKR